VLARIDMLNPRLNAFCTVTPELALAAAREAEDAVMKGQPLGPLHGVPFSIKDTLFTKGVRSMSGSFIFEHRVPAADPPFVRRLKAAGGVLVGKTTTPELGWKGVGDCPLTGITRNPWNTAVTTGGSSAGAGAAAAAGIGPVHLGTDGAGSIRIPAAMCGVFGMKPSYGRVPMWPAANNDYAGHVGPLTRTVADAALMLSIVAGPDDMDRTALDAAPADYVGLLDRGIRGLRVAFSPDLGGLRVDPEVAAPVRQAARVFEDLGCVVEEVAPGFADTHEMIRCIWAAHEAGNYGRYVEQWQARMDPGLVACIEDGLRCSVVDYIEMRGRKMAYWDTVRPLFERFDLLLTPSVSVAAFAVGRLNPQHWPQHAWDWLPWASFSYPFNFTGQPAASVPAGFTPSGLPVGLQIVGGRCADLTVLQAAAAFEAAQPWSARRPAVA
jgi:aspartyl-tRNA(Asn)/glutamyl-tRNA(Gln) amidotransferase subunit A